MTVKANKKKGKVAAAWVADWRTLAAVSAVFDTLLCNECSINTAGGTWLRIDLVAAAEFRAYDPLQEHGGCRGSP